MTRGTVLTLLGFGLGALVIAGRGMRPASLRDRALEAQRNAARAAQEARELAERWSQEESRNLHALG